MANNNSFTITHEFHAPVESVFEAWTSTEQLKQWFAPGNFSVIFTKADIKAGGESHYCIASEHGLKVWYKLFYKDFIAPAKLSFTQVYSNENGGIEPHPMIKNFPVEIFTTVMLDEKEGKTTVNLTWEPMNANAEQVTCFIDETFELSQEWGGMFAQLEAFLANS
ncbi:MAG: SRPBCC domain-containing protein [Proteobacteria bacterium]|nr:SRPBCC domain-containing protein [Pseudomonadota bacterium]NOG60669.1 SRPBCC domain-containing protein [Pseudomonadota bacterium]